MLLVIKGGNAKQIQLILKAIFFIKVRLLLIVSFSQTLFFCVFLFTLDLKGFSDSEIFKFTQSWVAGMIKEDKDQLLIFHTSDQLKRI